MKIIQLEHRAHDVKIGDVCGDLQPNVTEDCIFQAENGEIIGFYLKQVPDRLRNLVEIANTELLSDRVPKQFMDRKQPRGMDENGKKLYRVIRQWSTIIGSVPPKPHMRRNYPTHSSVHAVRSADTFVKAMLMACAESERIIQEITPAIYERQLREIEEHVPPRYRLGKLFTSSISNYNIAANYHIDGANLPGCVNVIICKRSHAKGGNTTIPDYDATVDSADNSMLVYPAWRNVHGVTPIHATAAHGYRNTLVFYALKSFNKYWDAPKDNL